MSTKYQKTELAANVLIIIAAVLMIGLFGQRYLLKSSASNQPDLPKAGDKLGLPDFDWSRNHTNVVLALQKNCHFCSDSAAFYRRLIEEAKGRNVKIVAVLPQDIKEGESYLQSLGISGIEVKQSQLDVLLVSGTPTILLANEFGQLTDVWFGKLPPDKENEVLAKVRSL
jgi:hypothetical protein